MYDDLGLDSLPEDHRICSILFDEMKIRSGLVFSSKTGRLIGFTELGQLNEELQGFEESVSKNKKESREMATHVLSVMARGLLKHFTYPICYFATVTADADQLFNILWEGVRVLEAIGIKVLAFICDGASQNRRFFSLHKFSDGSNVSVDGVVYWCFNRFDPNKERKIYFLSDPPHLMKTLRNNIEKSDRYSSSRHLMASFFILDLSFL